MNVASGRVPGTLRRQDRQRPGSPGRRRGLQRTTDGRELGWTPQRAAALREPARAAQQTHTHSHTGLHTTD